MEVLGFTDVGVRYKDNQDTYLSMSLEVGGTKTSILVLCDGMGGLEDGRFASQRVVSAIREIALRGDFRKESFLSAIEGVNSEIYEKYSSKGKQCGTTCSFVVLSEGKYFGYHIGDTRIYHFRGSNYKILTEDHTLVNLKRKRGEEVSEEFARKHRSTLSRCLGAFKSPRLDYIEGEYQEGDTFVACSDGFWHYWNMSLNNLEEEIARIKSLGELDNITVSMFLV